MPRRPAILIVLIAFLTLASACGAGDGESSSASGATNAGPPSDEVQEAPIAGSADEPAGTTTANPPAGSDGEAADGPAIRALPPAGGIPDVEPAGPQPVALSIPELGIDRSVVRAVGVEPNGEYEVPIASEIGWYRFGSAPGEAGSAVLAGHIAYDGENGVFSELASVEVGSTVEIVLDDGSTVTYEIVELETYEKTALPFDDIFSETGDDRVVLITCGGEFNPSLRSYESNVVAYAQPIAPAAG